MAYTMGQATALALQIYTRFGYKIHLACQGSGIDESFVAGFIGVEAGKDKSGIVENATRFERHVFEKLRALRDGLRGSYQSIRRAAIADASDDALRALATSYGLTQIMGWHVINNLKCSVGELRDSEKHLLYTIQLLKLSSGDFLRRKDYGSVLRIWNTGSANGKTYHADYVENALKVMHCYASLLKRNKPFQITDNEIKSAILAVEPTANVLPETLPDSPDSNSNPLAAQPPMNSPNNFTPEQFQAYIPQIDTAKNYLKTLSGLTGISAIVAFFTGLPNWVIVGLVVLLAIVVIGGIVMLVKYHAQIFAYVTAMNTLRATATVHNPVVSGDTPKS